MNAHKKPSPNPSFVWSLLAWLCVWLFWLLATRSFHPTWTLALIVTTSLITAYAAAAYLNHLVLIPRVLRAGRVGNYAFLLLAVMLVFTALALVVLRTAYIRAVGPAGVQPLAVAYGIDLFGMAVHLLGAAGVVWIVERAKRVRKTPSKPSDPPQTV